MTRKGGIDDNHAEQYYDDIYGFLQSAVRVRGGPRDGNRTYVISLGILPASKTATNSDSPQAIKLSAQNNAFVGSVCVA